MVRLKVGIGDAVDALLNFNSCMVRLKVSTPIRSILESDVFQFLYGAIKRLLGIRGYYKDTNFNSCMVRLKGAVTSY